MTGDSSAQQQADGVRMALITNRLQAIARRMQNTLFRTGRSGILNTAHDFSCVVLTPDCRLLVAAESLPLHVMVGPDIIAREILAHILAPSEAMPIFTIRPTMAIPMPPTTAPSCP